ncbi:hypothetical protein ACYZT3_16895 [Pseudomonas sp. MDT1-16]
MCRFKSAVVRNRRSVAQDGVSASANQLRGYLRALDTTWVLGMADWEALDRRVAESWL